MKISLIMTDVDGCVLMRNVTPSLRQVSIFQNYGRRTQTDDVPPLVFCTGRGAEFVQPLAQLLGLMAEKELPSVVESGSYLYYPFSRKMIPHPAIIGKGQLITEVKACLLKELVEEGWCTFIPGKEGSVSVIPLEGLSIAEFADEVKATVPNNLLEQIFISFSTTAVDVTVKGVDKGSVLDFYAQVTGIAAEEIMMIGDANNDLPILEVAGTVACPANATAEVKQLVQSRGGYVSKHEGPDGVADIIGHYS